MLVLPILVSSLTLPLSYFFLWSKTAYLLTAQKQDYHLLLKITKRILTWGKMWWEGACLCSWLYLMLRKSKFSFELGARRTESHGRPCCRDFLLTKELTWIILLRDNLQGNWIHLFHYSRIWTSWFCFLAVLFTNVQVLINVVVCRRGTVREFCPSGVDDFTSTDFSPGLHRACTVYPE